jgi:para-aminobenzoate synthetase/4-amino-4-deoxychorismate lyase
MQEWVLLENRRVTDDKTSIGLFFENPIEEIKCWHPSCVASSLNAIRSFQKQGYYVVGFVSYEAGYILNHIEAQSQIDALSLPLLHFMVYQACEYLNEQEIDKKLQMYRLRESTSCDVNNLRLNWSFFEYAQAFERIQRHILDGDTYQVNLTTQYQFDFTGSPVQLYQILRERQKVSYSGMLSFSDYQILTLSPELFFSKIGDKITVKPMKGTIKRGLDPIEDAQNKVWLKNDVKSIAENTMIVDLLRNDLSRISHPGSVQVSQLMHVEQYETVHQMVSCIESLVDSDIDISELMRALFPCGSITGAPKRRTMEIIRDIESLPRGIYTGALGYIMPNNDMCFNVCIRTLQLQQGRGVLGVGGGLVYDSRAVSEFDELQLKGMFFTQSGVTQS